MHQKIKDVSVSSHEAVSVSSHEAVSVSSHEDVSISSHEAGNLFHIFHISLYDVLSVLINFFIYLNFF